MQGTDSGDELDNVRRITLLRGLFRLGSATTAELSAFSQVPGDRVDSYLSSRPDLVGPREGDGPWRLRREVHDALRDEIRKGIDADPERLSEAFSPGHVERVRASLATIDEILDGMPDVSNPSERTACLAMLDVRIPATEKALRTMRRYGIEVRAELARLEGSKARREAIDRGGEAVDARGCLCTVVVAGRA